jgi:hypothetical protein
MPKEPSLVPTIGCTEVLAFRFCQRCNRSTLRRVYDSGAQGECMGCDPNFQTKAQQRHQQYLEKERQQPRLF